MRLIYFDHFIHGLSDAYEASRETSYGQNELLGMKESKIGTGVSVVDKASLHQSIFGLLQDCNMILEQPKATRISRRGAIFHVFVIRRNIRVQKNFASG